MAIVKKLNVLNQFNTLAAVNELAVCPPAGTMYVYQWSDDTKKDDWRAVVFLRLYNLQTHNTDG